MKLLLVAGKLSYSNPTIYTLELVRGLRAREHEVEIAYHGGALSRKLSELAVESYQVKHNYFSFRRMLQFIRDFGPAVIHATGGPLALETAGRIARATGVPFIHTLHSWLPEDQHEARHRHLQGIVVVNQSLREHLVNEANVPKSRIRVIQYGVDAAGFGPRGRRDTGTIPVVGTIGRLTRGRRLDEFLQAAASVRQRKEDVHFVVAGDGRDERRLRQLAKELGLATAVTFAQPNSSVEIFSVIDLLVFVSDWGGIGLNLLEGMAQGCPVIATGGGELFSILGEGDLCQIVPPNDSERLADEIIALLEDPDRRREIAENARKYVLANHSLDAHVIALEEYYESIMAPVG